MLSRELRDHRLRLQAPRKWETCWKITTSTVPFSFSAQLNTDSPKYFRVDNISLLQGSSRELLTLLCGCVELLTTQQGTPSLKREIVARVGFGTYA